MRRFLLLIAGLASFGLVAAACSSSDDGEVATSETAPSTTAGEQAATPEPAPTSVPEAATLPDYSEDVASLELAASDIELPPVDPGAPIGAYGYSRYVYNSGPNGAVVPTLIEGPRGQQVRCQVEDQDCSYQELKALYESGDEVPDYLGMDRDTLGELVEQLDRVNVAVTEYTSINLACERGFTRSTNQTANMGIHMIDGGAGNQFNPDRPQMVLFAREGGETDGWDDIGSCRDGVWTGDDNYKAVGAVFNLDLSEEHPDGFAGPIDNWHIHYNTCIAPREGNEVPEEGQQEGGVSTTREACQESGGVFLPRIGSWMMHAYVADEYESESGVFTMFNPNVWPVIDSADQLRSSRTEVFEDAINAPITNFDYGEINAGVGESIVFSNSDSVPHTVTSGSALDPTSDFDSGVLGTGQTFELSFDDPGEYPLFCVLHPDMQATVTVS